MGILKKINERVLKWATTEDNPKWKLYEKILLIFEGLGILITTIIFLLHFFHPEPPIYIIKTRIENLDNTNVQNIGLDNEKHKDYLKTSQLTRLMDYCGRFYIIVINYPEGSEPYIAKSYALITLGRSVGRDFYYSIQADTNKNLTAQE